MPRSIWKGAISFGLVHVPVALYPASSESEIDFDWLDRRSMDPVGYRRINKRTGREIEKGDIVKGIKVDDGGYVLLDEEDIRTAYPKMTQTIEIESFAKAAEIPFVHLERPYYLEPLAKGEKVYALLREAMSEAGVIGVARVVLHTKEHLAALVPAGAALMLNTLRWGAEIRPLDDLKLPAAGTGTLKSAELKMARELIGEMTQPWKPDEHVDRYADAIKALIAERIKDGKTTPVHALEAGESATASNVVDLSALLKQSLARRQAPAKDGVADPGKPLAKKSVRTKPAVRKRAAAAASHPPGKAAQRVAGRR